MRRKLLLGAAAGGSAMMLSLLMIGGCGGLLGGGERADLYRFGAVPDRASAVTPVISPQTAQPTLVAFAGSRFPASVDNRILTVSGTRVMYLAKSRWVAAAPELFDAALVQSLGRNAVEVRTVQKGQLQAPAYILLVDVSHFEARYVGDEKAPPEITIDARVQLLRRSNRTTIGEWTVTKVEPANANRVTSIVAAFDQATNSLTREIADLVRSAVQGGARV
jgi:cholesterol transport system auxiliary component